MNKVIKPSKYQSAIYDTVLNDRCSISIEAVAGSGKTFTLVNMLELIPKNKKTIFLAFNKHIAEELKTKVPNNVNVSTIHGFGFMCMKTYMGSKAKSPSENKSFWLAVKSCPKWGIDGEEKFPYAYRVSKLMDFMRMNMVEDDEEEILEIIERYGLQIFHKHEIKHAIELLQKSNRVINNEFDFIDMVYIPAVKNWKLRKFDYVLVDEWQDLSVMQHKLVQKIINPRSGRLICVGDRHQAIYQFAGADSNSYDKVDDIVSNVKKLPLSICYRSTKNIVYEAQRFVSHIEPNPNAEDGLMPRDGIADEIDGNVFVICRNNKPLVLMLNYLLSKGIKANIKDKEIGTNIIRLIEKTKQKKVVDLMKHLAVDRLRLFARLREKGVSKPDYHKSVIAYDEKVAIIEILSQKYKLTSQLKKYIESVFLDEEIDGVTLMTIHKSKGLEKDKVFFLNPELIPSTYAITPEQKQQEWNLFYVGVTRARKELIYIRNFG